MIVFENKSAVVLANHVAEWMKGKFNWRVVSVTVHYNYRGELGAEPVFTAFVQQILPCDISYDKEAAELDAGLAKADIAAAERIRANVTLDKDTFLIRFIALMLCDMANDKWSETAQDGALYRQRAARIISFIRSQSP